MRHVGIQEFIWFTLFCLSPGIIILGLYKESIRFLEDLLGISREARISGLSLITVPKCTEFRHVHLTASI